LKKLILWAVFATFLVAGIAYPNLSGRVVDEAGILPSKTYSELTAKISLYEQNSTNQFVVVTLKSLQGMSIDEYSLNLARKWEIGQKGSDNGVLLVVAPNERKVRIEVGYGLEGKLTDARASKIINSVIIPEFKDGNFAKGIQNGADEILVIINSDEEFLKAEDEKEALVTVILGLLFLIFSYYLYRKFREIIADIDFETDTYRYSGSSGNSSSRSSSYESRSYGSSSSRSSFRGGGGSFGGGGASGSW